MRRAAAAALALLAIGGCGGGDGPKPGPLEGDDTNAVGFSVPSYRLFYYGQPVVQNRGGRPATLRRAELVRPTAGLRVERALVSGVRRRDRLISGDRWFPPRFAHLTDVHPLDGYVVPPRTTKGVEIALALRAPQAGRRYVWHGVALEYEVGGKRYRDVLPTRGAVCAQRRERDLGRICETPPPA